MTAGISEEWNKAGFFLEKNKIRALKFTGAPKSESRVHAPLDSLVLPAYPMFMFATNIFINGLNSSVLSQNFHFGD